MRLCSAFLLITITITSINSQYNSLTKTPSFYHQQSTSIGQVDLSSSKPQDLTDIDKIQKVFQGLFAENQLLGPFMIKYCFDDHIAHITVQFVTELLAKAAKGSLTDLIQLVKDVKGFYSQLPYEFIECLGKCAQIQSLGHKYDIDGSIDTQALEIKVTKYFALHFLEVHGWAVDLNNKWIAGKYYQVGYAAGNYGHKVQHNSQIYRI